MTVHPSAAAFVSADPDGPAAAPNKEAMNSGACPESRQAMQRSSGVVELVFKCVDGKTRIDRAYQAGCGKVRLPRENTVPCPMAVLINTAGGLTGGDRLATSTGLQAGTQATVTTQAAERVYRSAAGHAVVTNRLELGPRARLDWLPQETILFDGGALNRQTTVEMAADAQLTATELLVFGRAAMGETVRSGDLVDRWRIVRDGRLVFADATRLKGAIAEQLAHAATADGQHALALVLHVAKDAEERLSSVRNVLESARDLRAGASAFDGVMIVRMVAPSGQALRMHALAVMACLRDGLPPPRPWLL